MPKITSKYPLIKQNYHIVAGLEEHIKDRLLCCHSPNYVDEIMEYIYSLEIHAMLTGIELANEGKQDGIKEIIYQMRSKTR